MPVTKSHLASLAVATTALIGGGVAIANAATGEEPSTSSSPSASSESRGDHRGGGPSADTPVTGAEKTKVVTAVEAAYDGVTITEVRQDPDGSYDALGTDADDNPVFYDVSEDLTTITEHTGGPGGHGGGPGGSPDTPVTGAERTKVVAAVKAEAPDLKVTEVRQDPDGSYDVLGTLDGAPVFYDVSEDLATVTEHTGGPGGRGDHGTRSDGTGSDGTGSTSGTTT